MTVMEETYDAFQTVGKIIRARINTLGNQGRFEEGKELQKGYDLINKHMNNALEHSDKLSDDFADFIKNLTN